MRQEDRSLDQRFSGYHLPLELSNGGFAEIGVNTFAEVITTPFRTCGSPSSIVR
jgi:hypothetical protein